MAPSPAGAGLNQMHDSLAKKPFMTTPLAKALPLPARILVAEDDQIHGELARHLLEAHGYDVDVVANGKDAVRAFRHQPSYALILMDCRMPQVDGFTAVKKIRRLERNEGTERSVPIIALTVFLDAIGYDRCLRSGMNGCLTKPLDLNSLGRILTNLSPASEED